MNRARAATCDQVDLTREFEQIVGVTGAQIEDRGTGPRLGARPCRQEAIHDVVHKDEVPGLTTTPENSMGLVSHPVRTKSRNHSGVG